MPEVSIPFREELHSDDQLDRKVVRELEKWFPSLSGKSSIRTQAGWPSCDGRLGCVSIPFREDLYSDKQIDVSKTLVYEFRFPSLSGKTFIRTVKVKQVEEGRFLFPSLSGKTFIRTPSYLSISQYGWYICSKFLVAD